MAKTELRNEDGLIIETLKMGRSPPKAQEYPEPSDMCTRTLMFFMVLVSIWGTFFGFKTGWQPRYQS